MKNHKPVKEERLPKRDKEYTPSLNILCLSPMNTQELSWTALIYPHNANKFTPTLECATQKKHEPSRFFLFTQGVINFE